MKSFMVSAAHKSSGKTTVSVGLARALTVRGHSVQPFKKGPDYIDPMWLGRAAGRPCRNLDFYTMQPSEITGMFTASSAEVDLALVEGNKGLFDGVDLEGVDSNAALAKLLGIPVILVIDTMGMTRGIAPLIAGYRSFDAEVVISGIILNRVGGPRHEGKLRAAVERYTDLPVLGAIGRHPEIEITERHLGLVPANEAVGADDLVSRIGSIIESEVDIDSLLRVAAPPHSLAAGERNVPPRHTGPGVRIGVARDAAFGFYYPDDLEALGRAGAELVAFDTLSDQRLPAVDGLFFGGGFPELHMPALAGNTQLKGEIRSALLSGLPAYAECGGLLYLARSLTWQGETHDMVGVIPGDGVIHERPVGRGYVRLRETGNGPWAPACAGDGADLPAHEFHYASLDGLTGKEVYAYAVERGHGIDGRNDGLVIRNLVACFAHQRDVAANRWAQRFVEFVRRNKQIGEKTERPTAAAGANA